MFQREQSETTSKMNLTENKMTHTSWNGKRVLVTGVCGTVGRELLRQIVRMRPLEVVGIDNNESELFFLSEAYRDDDRVHLYLSDLRDRTGLIKRARGIDIILHAAALKHVILCEHSPSDAIQTNILGTQNVIDAAMHCDVERVIFTSSDKAVNPTNVMGTSKLMGERLMTAANACKRGEGPIFAATRFGNVLGSRGSVIPLFKRQIANGGPVTLTDRRMTRFIMTLEQAVHLVMESVFMARGGEVFVTKMPVVRIEDLAIVMIEELEPDHGYVTGQISMAEIGSKAGEKFYEELLNEEEIRRTIELPKYFVALPAFKSVYENIDYIYPGMNGTGLCKAYNSSVETPMTKEALRSYLLEHNLLTELEEVHACA